MNKKISYKLKTGYLDIEIENINNNYEFNDLCDVSSRINKKRGFVFVSKVLGKHYPSKPLEMQKIHINLAQELNNKIINKNKTLVIGFAETAIGIGQGVFEELYSIYENANENLVFQHSTRFLTNEKIELLFEEEHCHAPSHIFYKFKNENLENIKNDIENIVLVDDEVSTGNTALNFIKEFQKKYPKVKKYYIVSILNWISNENYHNIINEAIKLNIEIEFIDILKGTFSFSWNDNFNTTITNKNIISICSNQEKIKEKLSNVLKNNYGRYGIQKLNLNFENYISKDDIKILKNKKVLILGTAEFMHIPYLLGKYLENNNIETYIQSTTRSPLNEDIIINSKLEFKDNYFENIDNFLYNVNKENDYDIIYICYETNEIPKNHNLKNLLKKNNFKYKELFC